VQKKKQKLDNRKPAEEQEAQQLYGEHIIYVNLVYSTQVRVNLRNCSEEIIIEGYVDWERDIKSYWVSLAP
jgi:hypothetical protein